MGRFDSLAKHGHTLAERRLIFRRPTGVAALALIIAAVLVTAAALVSNAGRAEQAVISFAKDTPELHAGGTRLERRGAWRYYEPQF